MVVTACPDQEAAAHELLHLYSLEAGRPEEGAQLALVVVEDRAVVDPLVADLADRPLEPGPSWKAGDRGAPAERQHPAGEPIGFIDVVEQSHGDDHVEWSLQSLLEEVPGYQVHPISEAAEAALRQLDHRPGEVDAHVLDGAGFQQLLSHAAGAAADVEDARALQAVDQVDRGFGPEEEARPQDPLQAVVLYLVVVELVKRSRRALKVLLDALRGPLGCGRGLVHRYQARSLARSYESAGSPFAARDC